jgi:ankyrin repeat protein
MYASFHGHARAVKVLLNAGADADFCNSAGLTAVQLARKEGFEDAANAILEGPNILVSCFISYVFLRIVLLHMYISFTFLG